jgi:hypothetical protein
MLNSYVFKINVVIACICKNAYIYIYKKKIHSVLIKINIRIIKKNVRITCIFELVST